VPTLHIFPSTQFLSHLIKKEILYTFLFTYFDYNNLKLNRKELFMQQSFEVLNVKCGSCASTLKSKLAKDFGEIEVNLEVLPRKITLDMENRDLDKLAKALRELGYPLASEEMSFMDCTSAKAKSFVSCAVGKMNS